MNTAQSTQTDQVQDQKPATTPRGGKEVEPIVSPSEGVTEISSEVPLHPEVEKAGVKQFRETIELPPDVKKLGVIPSHQPLSQVSSASLPQVALPISDSAVFTGLHAPILAAIRWLATWCRKKLKKAHIVLKAVHGKVIRVKT